MDREKGFSKLLFAAVSGVLIVVTGGTVLASNGAKPGDPLFPVDITVENIQLSLTPTTQGKINLRNTLADERVAELKALLAETEISIQDSQVGLDALVSQKQEVTDLLSLKAQGEAIDVQANQLDDEFDQRETVLEAAFDQVKAPLEIQEKQLKLQIARTLLEGNTGLVSSLKSQLLQIETQLDLLELREDAAEEALEAEKAMKELEE